MSRKFTWGVSELDEVFGEIPGGYSLLLEGPPGVGKTSFAIQLVCENAKLSVKSLYITLYEGSVKLYSVARSIGCDLEKLVNEGVVKIITPPIVGDYVLADSLVKSIAENMYDYDIVVIDSITPILQLLEKQGDKRAFLHTILYRLFSQGGKLLILVTELLGDKKDARLLEYLADIVLDLSFVEYKKGGIMRRMLLKKFRARKTLNLPLYFGLSSEGVRIYNYISEKLSRRLLQKRRPISIQCECAQKIFGSSIPPGTQVFIHIVGDVVGLESFITYLHKLIKKAVDEQGYNPGLINYSRQPRSMVSVDKLTEKQLKTSIDGVYKHVMDSIRELKDRLIVRRVDPGLANVDEILGLEIDLSVQSNVGVLLIHGLEKAVDVYGHDAVGVHSVHAMNNLRKLGTTCFRIFISPTEDIVPPRSYYVWSDIVLRAYSTRDHSFIKIMKSTTARTGEEIPIDLFNECIRQGTI